MSVNPGFGGQSFIPSALKLLRDCRAIIGDRDIDLEIDGGVTAANAADIAAAGANVLVAGSAAFKGGRAQYAANVAAIRQAAEAGAVADEAFTPGSAARHGGRAADRDPDCPARRELERSRLATCRHLVRGRRAGLARSQCYARGDRPAGPSASCADPAEYRLPSGLSRGGEPRLSRGRTGSPPRL